MLPALDIARYFLARRAAANAYQYRVNAAVAALRALNRLQQAGHTGAIERRAGGGARAFIQNGVVILQKLRFLRILKRDNVELTSTARLCRVASG